MIKCLKCGEDSIIRVAVQEGTDIEFFACCNEECSNYAELLVENCGALHSVHGMLDAYREVVKEVTNEKNRVRRS